jgi:hypothetical protein
MRTLKTVPIIRISNTHIILTYDTRSGSFLSDNFSLISEAKRLGISQNVSFLSNFRVGLTFEMFV